MVHPQRRTKLINYNSTGPIKVDLHVRQPNVKHDATNPLCGVNAHLTKCVTTNRLMLAR
jgi:hypothetical protein